MWCFFFRHREFFEPNKISDVSQIPPKIALGPSMVSTFPGSFWGLKRMGSSFDNFWWTQEFVLGTWSFLCWNFWLQFLIPCRFAPSEKSLQVARTTWFQSRSLRLPSIWLRQILSSRFQVENLRDATFVHGWRPLAWNCQIDKISRYMINECGVFGLVRAVFFWNLLI